MSSINLDKMSKGLLVQQPENLSKIQSKETLKNLRLSTVATTIIAAGGFAVSHHKNLLTGRVKALVGAVALLFAGVAAYFQKYNILSNVEETLGHVFATGYRKTVKDKAMIRSAYSGEKLFFQNILRRLGDQTSVQGVAQFPSSSGSQIDSYLFYAQACVTGDNHRLTRLYMYDVEKKEAVVLTILPVGSKIEMGDQGVHELLEENEVSRKLPFFFSSAPHPKVFITVGNIDEVRKGADAGRARSGSTDGDDAAAAVVPHYFLTRDELKAEQAKVGKGKDWKVRYSILDEMSKGLLVQQPENPSRIQSKETLENLRLSTVATTIIAAGGFAVSHHKNLLTGRVKALVGAVALLFAGVAAYFQKYNILSNVEETLGHVFATGYRKTVQDRAIIRPAYGNRLFYVDILDRLDDQPSVQGVVQFPAALGSQKDSYLFYAQACVTRDNQELTRLYMYDVEKKEAVVLTILPVGSTIEMGDQGVHELLEKNEVSDKLPFFFSITQRSKVFITVGNIDEVRKGADAGRARSGSTDGDDAAAAPVVPRYFLTRDELKAEQAKVGKGKAWKVGRLAED